MGSINRHTRLDDLPEFLTLEEYATYVDVSPSAAYEHLQTRKVHAVKFGRFWRVPRASLMAMTSHRYRTEVQAWCEGFGCPVRCVFESRTRTRCTYDA